MAGSSFPVVDPPRVQRAEVLKVIREAKSALVVGAGLTGIAACRLFASSGLRVTVVDENELSSHATKQIAELGIRSAGLNELNTELQRSTPDFALFSPGVSPGGPAAKIIFEAGVRSLSELDMLGEMSSDPLVAITGTNGKSTTATLIYEMLRGSGVELVGNIGVPFIELLSAGELRGIRRKNRKFVAEISSYQLEWADECRPKIAVVLNLAENHLERHLTMRHYADAKMKLISSLSTSDFVILNKEEPWAEEFAKATKASIVYFGLQNSSSPSNSENVSLLSPDGMSLQILLRDKKFNFGLADTKLIGFHNKMNLAAAIPAALLADQGEAQILEVINSFQALEHRLETVPNGAGLTVINDSKATTAHAAATDLRAVISSYKGRPVTLLIGGLEKIGSWSVLTAVFDESVKQVFGFGRDGEKIIASIRELGAGIPLNYTGSIESTLQAVLPTLAKDDVLLFAPGCPSFDAYRSFEERGKDFKRLIGELAHE